MKLNERIMITRNMIWEINTYQDFLEYLSYDLHDTPSRIDINEGVYFVWRSLMGLQILTLSKLIKDDGAFSLGKLIKIGGAKIKGFDKGAMQEEFEEIQKEFKDNKLDDVRDKFIAHLDISSDEIKTDIHMLCILKNRATSIFGQISVASGYEEYEHDDRCVKSIRQIFDDLDDFEKMKAILIASQVQGNRTINIEDLVVS